MWMEVEVILHPFLSRVNGRLIGSVVLDDT